MKIQFNMVIIKNIVLVVIVFVLAIFVLNTSYLLVSNSIVDSFKIDKITSSYLSFNYADNVSKIYEIDTPRRVSDFKGKRLLNEYYDFEVSIPEDIVTLDKVEYEVILKDVGNKIDGKFIKVYLTDQDNKAYSGYENTIPVYNAFADAATGKVIYIGTFTKGDSDDKYRLRIWISDAYKNKIKDDLAFKVSVKIK